MFLTAFCSIWELFILSMYLMRKYIYELIFVWNPDIRSRSCLNCLLSSFKLTNLSFHNSVLRTLTSLSRTICLRPTKKGRGGEDQKWFRSDRHSRKGCFLQLESFKIKGIFSSYSSEHYYIGCVTHVIYDLLEAIKNQPWNMLGNIFGDFIRNPRV